MIIFFFPRKWGWISIWSNLEDSSTKRIKFEISFKIDFTKKPTKNKGLS